MMLRLAVAQLRANRVFTLWTAGLMTVLVAILAYIVIAGATQVEVTRANEALTGTDRDSHGFVRLVFDDAAEAFYAGDRSVTTPSKFAAAFDASTGHDAMAMSFGWVRSTPLNASNIDTWSDEPGLTLLAAKGDGTGPALVGGVAPTVAGEIALAENSASDLGLALGDDFIVYTVEWGTDGEPSTTPHAARLVGVTASNHILGYDADLPDGYVSWEEVSTPTGMFTGSELRPDGTTLTFSWLNVHWNGDDKSLDPYRDQGWPRETLASFDLPSSITAWFGAAIALFIAMIVMSFAVGRSQASARTQWVATVRTMGARRSHIVAAATIETLVLAAIALVAGTALGVGIAQLQLWVGRASTGSTFGPASIGWHWVIVPVVVGATAVVAIVIAAVPAFWAARVAPTAALKPVSDVTEAEVSRRVPVTWIALPFVIGAALTWLGSTNSGAPIEAVAALGWIIVIVAGFALVVELLRILIPVVGRRLARSKRPSLLTAGDSLSTRPRQAVAPALLVAVAIALLTLWSCGVAEAAFRELAEADGDLARWGGLSGLSEDYLRSSLLGFSTLSTIVVAGLALQLVAAGIITNHRAATSREAAARRAMGLSRGAEAEALWWQQWIPQVMGVFMGLAVGVIGYLAVLATSTDPSGGEPLGTTARIVGFGAGYTAIVAIGMLAVAAVVALVVARTSRAATPLAALAPAG